MKKEYRMKLFTSGKDVVYNGRHYVVEYVVIRGFDLFVRLYDHRYEVHSDEVHCELTTLSLLREI